MTYINRLLCFCFIFLISMISIADESIIYQDKPTAQAANLVNEYMHSSDEEKKRYIAKLKSLTNENPTNINVRNMYANILIAHQNYTLGLEQLILVNNQTQKPGSKLTECMLRERIKQDPQSCYTDAISLFEKHKNNDSNYLMALFLANDSRFNAEKEKLIKRQKLSGNDAIFSVKRDEIIKTFFP